MSDAPTADPTASLRRIRWAQAVAFGVVGLALLATAAQSLIGAQRSAETLTIGQGRRLLDALQQAHHTFGPSIDEHAADVLKQHEEFGLRCIGLFRREHVRRVGDCVLSEAAMREVLANTVPDRPVTVGDHVAMIDDPGRGPGLPGSGSMPGELPPERDGSRPRDQMPRFDESAAETQQPQGGLPAVGDQTPRVDVPTAGDQISSSDPPSTQRPQRPPDRRGFAHDRPPPGRYDPDDGRPPPGRFGSENGRPPPGRYRQGGPPPRHGGGRGRGRAPILPPVLIEFEPIEAETLQASVAQGAIVALIAVAALLVSGFVLFRLTRRAEQLQEQAERDRRLVTLGEMASVLAHEIRNPLAALKGHAQLLAEQLPDDGRERRSANRVVRSAVRLESLTEDLLSLVRSNQVEKRDVSPDEIVRDSLAQVDFDRFDVDLSGAPARWRLDPNRMQQVLVNLLQNAADASADGQSATVYVRERGGSLVFVVRDSGSGIPPGEETRIFDPFFTKRTQGTGLGLAVARRIVELHGGTIAGRNLDSGGAEFEVVIP